MMNVAERTRSNAPAEAQRWLASFEAALQAQDAAAAAALFLRGRPLARRAGLHLDDPDRVRPRGHRDNAARDAGAHAAKEFPHSAAPHAAALGHPRRHRSIEALFEFETALRPGQRRVAAGARSAGQSRLRAWTLNTNLHELRGHEEEFKRARRARLQRATSAPRTGATASQGSAHSPTTIPSVIVVGGGQAGLSIAARLHQLGVDTLIVDRHERIGDNWRTRYHSLTLHNEVFVNHLPYLPFPPTFPGLHPEGQAGELVRVLRRSDGAEFLDRHRTRRRQL